MDWRMHRLELAGDPLTKECQREGLDAELVVSRQRVGWQELPHTRRAPAR
jgi:hypothetical protein